MSYPKELLPENNYKERIETACLTDEVLLRRSNLPRSEMLNRVGTIKIKALGLEDREYQLFSYSLNIKGIFKEGHLDFILDRKVHSEWQKSNDIINISDVVFEKRDFSVPIYIKVDSINEKPFSYKKGNNKGKINEFVGVIKVEHKPIDANYWHFEFVIHDENNNPITMNQKPWKTEAAKAFMAITLKEIATPFCNSFCNITQECFIQK